MKKNEENEKAKKNEEKEKKWESPSNPIYTNPIKNLKKNPLKCTKKRPLLDVLIDFRGHFPTGSKRCFPNGVFQISLLGSRQRTTLSEGLRKTEKASVFKHFGPFCPYRS